MNKQSFDVYFVSKFAVISCLLTCTFILPNFCHGQCAKNGCNLVAPLPATQYLVPNLGTPNQPLPPLQQQFDRIQVPSQSGNEISEPPGLVKPSGREAPVNTGSPIVQGELPLGIPEPDRLWSNQQLGLTLRFPANWSKSQSSLFVASLPIPGLNISEEISAGSSVRDQLIQVATSTNASFPEVTRHILDYLLSVETAVKRGRRTRNGQVFETIRYVQSQGGTKVNSLLLFTEHQGNVLVFHCAWTTKSSDLKTILDSMHFTPSDFTSRDLTKKNGPQSTGQYSNTKPHSASKDLPAADTTVTSTDSSLESIIKNLGYDLKSKDTKGNHSFSTVHPKTKIAYPFVANFDANSQELVLLTRLAKVPNDVLGASLRAQSLEKLSVRNTKAKFHFHEEQQNLSLVHLDQNVETVDQESFAKKVSHMIEVIERTRSLWNPKRWHMPRHYGTWRAPIEGKYYDLILNPEGTFKLIFSEDDKPTELSGNYAINGKRLELTDSSGFVVESDLHFVDGNRFELSINDESLVFVRQ